MHTIAMYMILYIPMLYFIVMHTAVAGKKYKIKTIQLYSMILSIFTLVVYYKLYIFRY